MKSKLMICMACLIMSISAYADSSANQIEPRKPHEAGAAESALSATVATAGAVGIYGVISTSTATGSGVLYTVGTGLVGGGAIIATAGTAGYFFGHLLVLGDQHFLQGKMISATGEFLGPVNRVIYKMINGEELPRNTYATAEGQVIKIDNKKQAITIVDP